VNLKSRSKSFYQNGFQAFFIQILWTSETRPERLTVLVFNGEVKKMHRRLFFVNGAPAGGG